MSARKLAALGGALLFGAQTVSVICPDGKRRPLPPEGESKGLRCKLPD